MLTLFCSVLVGAFFIGSAKSGGYVKSSVWGRGPEGGAIRPKTGEDLYRPGAGPSVSRTGCRRHAEPLVFARREFKALSFECQGLIPA